MTATTATLRSPAEPIVQTINHAHLYGEVERAIAPDPVTLHTIFHCDWSFWISPNHPQYTEVLFRCVGMPRYESNPMHFDKDFRDAQILFVNSDMLDGSKTGYGLLSAVERFVECALDNRAVLLDVTFCQNRPIETIHLFNIIAAWSENPSAEGGWLAVENAIARLLGVKTVARQYCVAYKVDSAVLARLEENPSAPIPLEMCRGAQEFTPYTTRWSRQGNVNAARHAWGDQELEILEQCRSQGGTQSQIYQRYLTAIAGTGLNARSQSSVVAMLGKMNKGEVKL